MNEIARMISYMVMLINTHPDYLSTVIKETGHYMSLNKLSEEYKA